MNKQAKQIKINIYFNFISGTLKTFKQKSEIPRECSRFNTHFVSS